MLRRTHQMRGTSPALGLPSTRTVLRSKSGTSLPASSRWTNRG